MNTLIIKCIRTNSGNKEFRNLVAELDDELKIRDGDEHPFYDQFNKIDKIQFAVVAYDGSASAGCGAIKEYSADTMEIKRMFVPPELRGKGIASVILKELENWASEMGYSRCILETGKRQPEAISLYLKNGYKIIPNFGQYADAKNSVCFEKKL